MTRYDIALCKVPPPITDLVPQTIYGPSLIDRYMQYRLKKSLDDIVASWEIGDTSVWVQQDADDPTLFHHHVTFRPPLRYIRTTVTIKKKTWLDATILP